MAEKVTIDAANRLGREGFVGCFGLLYERSPWVADEAYLRGPFDGIEGLHAAMVEAVDAAPEARQMALIRAHPDLAGKAAVAGELTPESTREQSSAGLDTLTPEEYGEFQRLNSAYRERFGFPLIFAVREHTKESILAGAQERLRHSDQEEVQTALAEVHKIARMRLEDLVEPG